MIKLYIRYFDREMGYFVGWDKKTSYGTEFVRVAGPWSTMELAQLSLEVQRAPV